MAISKQEGLKLVILVCWACCSSFIITEASEAMALLSVKGALIDELGHLENWNSGSPCLWRGVTCNGSEVVIALDISNMNLSGPLHPAIGDLPHLVNLSMAMNNLSGSLPTEIANLAHLRYLNISNNAFGYTFPRNFSQLRSLEVLDAFNNNFTGDLPLEVSLLTNLTHLHLGGNFFSGIIHPQYGNMESLQYLALSGNGLTGRIPPELGNLAKLQFMFIGYYNQFDGGIPVELGRLENLVRLDIANSGLTGNIPSILGTLSNLDSLFLQTNGLFGPIPPELGNLTNLKSLDVSNNHLTGPIPEDFANLQKLELCNLFLNVLHGVIPSFVGDLPHLQVLNLWKNNLTGPVPQHLGSSGELLLVDLSSNALTGPIPPDLCRGGGLQRLILFENSFSGPIPEGMTSCPKLSRVRLGHNQLSGHLPEDIMTLPELDILELHYNNLSGSLPTHIPAVSKLGSLDLSHNHFTGFLPPSIANLSQLDDLYLSANMLSGSIPSEIGSLKRLGRLFLSKNLFCGPIPTELSGCTALVSLDLSRNRLDGGIPSDLSRLIVLETLNVSRNHLKGPIPPSLGNMVTLSVVDFSFNEFSGVIPDMGQFASFNVTSFLGNPNLCGKQMQVPCAALEAEHEVKNGKPQMSLVYGMIGLVVGLSILTVGAVVYVLRNDRDRQFLWSLFRMGVRKRQWNLIAYEKLEFNVGDVLECMVDENVIGKGGAGTVFKGLMPSGQMVAIKRLSAVGGGGVRASSANSNSGEDDYGFSAEIQTLGNIRHRHIVRLLGCCSNHDTNLLLYEYMPNGSLGELLHGPRGGTLSWPTRCRVAVEAAKGLCYLHHDCTPVIIHRDVKSNNILLDSNYEAHVADFGLARALQDSAGQPESFSSVAGSHGYIAPEYVYTLKINEKSDIYSFGVVLLELVTGRRPIEPEFGECTEIARWVRKKVQTRDGVAEVVDSRMMVEGSAAMTVMMQEAMLMLRVALQCVLDLPEQRPSMREVVRMLSDILIKVRDQGAPTSKPPTAIINAATKPAFSATNAATNTAINVSNPSPPPPSSSPPDLISM